MVFLQSQQAWDTQSQISAIAMNEKDGNHPDNGILNVIQTTPLDPVVGYPTPRTPGLGGVWGGLVVRRGGRGELKAAGDKEEVCREGWEEPYFLF